MSFDPSTPYKPLTRPILPSSIDGAAAGLLAAASIAAFFLVTNLLSGSPMLETAAVLGTALFSGTDALVSSGPDFSFGVIFGYTLVHVTFFVAYGMAIAWLFRQARDKPWFGAFAILLLVIIQAPFVASTMLFGIFTENMLSGVELAVGNAVGTLMMSIYIVGRSPKLIEQIRRGAWSTQTVDAVVAKKELPVG